MNGETLPTQDMGPVHLLFVCLLVELPVGDGHQYAEPLAHDVGRQVVGEDLDEPAAQVGVVPASLKELLWSSSYLLLPLLRHLSLVTEDMDKIRIYRGESALCPEAPALDIFDVLAHRLGHRRPGERDE